MRDLLSRLLRGCSRRHEPKIEVSEEDWRAAFDVHVHPVFYLCREAVPALRQNKEGAIILISSAAGLRGIHTNIDAGLTMRIV